MLSDLRIARRMLARRPGLTAGRILATAVLVGIVSVEATTIGERSTPDTSLTMLLAAAAAVALVCAANLANLTRADALSRGEDYAIRAALGASRVQLLRPEIVQSVLVGAAGTAAGAAGAALVGPSFFTEHALEHLVRRPSVVDWWTVWPGSVAALGLMIAAVAAPMMRDGPPRSRVGIPATPGATRVRSVRHVRERKARSRTERRGSFELT